MNITFQGNAVTLNGNTIKVGDDAPIVWLKQNDLGTYQVGGKKDKIQVLNVVPSLDTSVCALQTKTFNQKASLLPEVEINVISMDLPFAQGRFCSTEGIKNLTTLSDFAHKEFGVKYGLLITNAPLEGLLTRAVIIIDKNGKVVYEEICAEVTHEPNYQAALDFLKK